MLRERSVIREESSALLGSLLHVILKFSLSSSVPLPSLVNILTSHFFIR